MNAMLLYGLMSHKFLKLSSQLSRMHHVVDNTIDILGKQTEQKKSMHVQAITSIHVQFPQMLVLQMTF